MNQDAKELVKKGVLTAYSVGITRPDFIPDPTGKAVRVITGRKDGASSRWLRYRLVDSAQ